MTCEEARDLLRRPAVRRLVENQGDRDSSQAPLTGLVELRAHLAQCYPCARRMSVDRAIGIILDYQASPVSDADLAPAVLNAIRTRKPSGAMVSLGRRWASLPVEWRAVPLAGVLCAGLMVGWLASREAHEPDSWLAGFQERPVERSLVAELVPSEPWGGEGQ